VVLPPAARASSSSGGRIGCARANPRCDGFVRALALRLLSINRMRAMSRAGIATVAVAAIILLFGGTCAATYNKLVRLDQAADAQWAQVQNAYQRRADLIPNLVETVKGAATFERDTLTAITEARARVGQVTVPKDITTNPQAFQQYQSAQDQLGGALSRLLVVAEAYPSLRATENFRDLQAQLEGTENRIAVERMRFNEAARDFNTARASFPTSLVAGIFGDRFAAKQYFTAKAGSEVPPKVKF
jgi:LemA protein